MSATTSPRLRLNPMARAIAATLGLGLGLGTCVPAFALNWQFDDLGVDLNTRVSAGAAMRTQGADPTYISIAKGGKAYSNNIDDGDLAFHRAGQVVAQPNKITSTLTVTYKSFGLFGRANYTYDPVLQDKTFFNANDYGAGKEYGYSKFADKQRQVHDHLGSDGTVLDLYAYANGDLFGHSASIKVGKQIINWGESTLVLNGLNSLVSLDANKARLPGAELSEFDLPVPQVFASLAIVENVSVEGFYQWKFEPTIVDMTGSFYPIPDQDYAGTGGSAGDISFGRAPENSLPGTDCSTTGGNNFGSTTCVPYGGTIPRGAAHMPKGAGQFGGAVRFLIPQLNDTEMAFYAANYHSRLPLFSTTSATSGNVSSQSARFFAEYPEDIKMYGMSFNASLPWGIAFQGEYSYKPNAPAQLSSVEVNLSTLGAPSQLDPIPGQTLGGQYIRGFRRKQISQFDFGFTKILTRSPFFHYDQILLIAEVAGDRVHNLEKPGTLAYEGFYTFQPNTASESFLFQVPQQVGGYPTANSWGYKLLAKATYNNVFSGFTLEPGVRFDHDVHGITPLPYGNFVQASRLVGLSVGWRYLDNLTGELGYNMRFGGGASNLWRDRDTLETFVRYSF